MLPMPLAYSKIQSTETILYATYATSIYSKIQKTETNYMLPMPLAYSKIQTTTAI